MNHLMIHVVDGNDFGCGPKKAMIEVLISENSSIICKSSTSYLKGVSKEWKHTVDMCKLEGGQPQIKLTLHVHGGMFSSARAVATSRVDLSEIPHDGSPTVQKISMGGGVVTLRITWRSETLQQQSIQRRALAAEKLKKNIGGIQGSILSALKQFHNFQPEEGPSGCLRIMEMAEKLNKKLAQGLNSIPQDKKATLFELDGRDWGRTVCEKVFEAFKGLPDGEFSQGEILRWLRLVSNIKKNWEQGGGGILRELEAMQVPLVTQFCHGCRSVLESVSENVVSMVHKEAHQKQKKNKEGKVISNAPQDFFSLLIKNYTNVLPFVKDIATMEFVTMQAAIIRHFLDRYQWLVQGYLLSDSGSLGKNGSPDNVNLTQNSPAGMWVTPLGMLSIKGGGAEEPVILLQGAVCSEEAICGIIGSTKTMAKYIDDIFGSFQQRVDPSKASSKHIYNHLTDQARQIHLQNKELLYAAVRSLGDYASVTIALDAFQGLFDSKWEKEPLSSQSAPRCLIVHFLFECVMDYGQWLGWNQATEMVAVEILAHTCGRYASALSRRVKRRKISKNSAIEGVQNDFRFIKSHVQSHNLLGRLISAVRLTKALAPLAAILLCFRANECSHLHGEFSMGELVRVLGSAGSMQVVRNVQSKWKLKDIKKIINSVSKIAKKAGQRGPRHERDEKSNRKQQLTLWEGIRNLCLSYDIPAILFSPTHPSAVLSLPQAVGFKVMHANVEDTEFRVIPKRRVALQSGLRSALLQEMMEIEKNYSRSGESDKREEKNKIKNKSGGLPESEDEPCDIITLEDLLENDDPDAKSPKNIPNPNPSKTPSDPPEEKKELKKSQKTRPKPLPPLRSKPAEIARVKVALKEEKKVLENSGKFLENSGKIRSEDTAVTSGGNPFGNYIRDKEDPDTNIKLFDIDSEAKMLSKTNPFSADLSIDNPAPDKRQVPTRLFSAERMRKLNQRSVRHRRPQRTKGFSPGSFFFQQVSSHAVVGASTSALSFSASRGNPFAPNLASRMRKDPYALKHGRGNPFARAILPTETRGGRFASTNPFGSTNPFSAEPKEGKHIPGAGNPFGPSSMSGPDEKKGSSFFV